MNVPKTPDPPEVPRDNVPVFGSWFRWYVFLLSFLAIQILLYSWLTFRYL